MTGIEDVAQAVAEQIERKTHEQDRRTGQRGHPPGVELAD